MLANHLLARELSEVSFFHLQPIIICMYYTLILWQFNPLPVYMYNIARCLATMAPYLIETLRKITDLKAALIDSVLVQHVVSDFVSPVIA